MGGEGRSGFSERAPSLWDNTEQCSQIWRHTTECVWVCSARTIDTMVGGMIYAPWGRVTERTGCYPAVMVVMFSWFILSRRPRKIQSAGMTDAPLHFNERSSTPWQWYTSWCQETVKMRRLHTKRSLPHTGNVCQHRRREPLVAKLTRKNIPLG